VLNLKTYRLLNLVLELGLQEGGKISLYALEHLHTQASGFLKALASYRFFWKSVHWSKFIGLKAERRTQGHLLWIMINTEVHLLIKTITYDYFCLIEQSA